MAYSARACADHPDELRIAFDGDAVLFSDEAEQVFQAQGLAAFQEHETIRSACIPDRPHEVARAIANHWRARSAERRQYQVGELAKLMYPGGVTVDELEHQIALEKTRELLMRDQVVIFEAALAFENYFIRVDVLKKSGNSIELILL